jgi:hypothetical protein
MSDSENVHVMPLAAAKGLAEAAGIRAKALAAGAPNFPADEYSAGFAATAQTLWAQRASALAANVAEGLAESAKATTHYAQTEDGNATSLGT